MSPKDALNIAREQGLDLVEIAPAAKPPVCRIVDFGKFRYEKKKREKEQKKAQTKQSLKEVRLHPRTDTHDLDFKKRHARDWLLEGHKVKFSVFFKGRERAHPDIGRDLLKTIIESFEDIAKVDQSVQMERWIMHMMLAPDKKKIEAIERQKKKDEKRKEADEATTADVVTDEVVTDEAAASETPDEVPVDEATADEATTDTASDEVASEEVADESAPDEPAADEESAS